jgi:hypothetical protein
VRCQEMIIHDYPYAVASGVVSSGASKSMFDADMTASGRRLLQMSL